jgi:hypothetical protein
MPCPPHVAFPLLLLLLPRGGRAQAELPTEDDCSASNPLIASLMVQGAVSDPAQAATLERIDLPEGLTSLEGIACLPRLETLLAAHRGLRDLEPLRDHPSLTKADLSGNKIASVAPLATIPTLRDLNLSHNLIVDPTPLAANRQLDKLDLGNNRISDFSALRSAGVKHHAGPQYPDSCLAVFEAFAEDPGAPLVTTQRCPPWEGAALAHAAPWLELRDGCQLRRICGAYAEVDCGFGQLDDRRYYDLRSRARAGEQHEVPGMSWAAEILPPHDLDCDR